MYHLRKNTYKTLRPVFSGKTESDTEIATLVLYTDNDNKLDAYIKVGDNPVTPLSSPFKMELGFDATSFVCFLHLESAEWTGNAKGSREDLEMEPYYKFEPDYHVRRE